MNVSILFPPSICLPNQIYYALPLLSAVLRQAGHRPRAIDLNLAAADLLLERRMAETLFVECGDQLVERARRAGRAKEAEAIRNNLDHNLALVVQGEACKRALRDPDRFWDQPTFKHAFWTIVDVLAAFYQLDPLVSPFRSTFRADVVANQKADAWTAMRELYDRGLLDEAVAGDPDVIGITLAFPEQVVETVRLMRKIRQRRPDVPIVVGGPLVTGFADRWLEDGWLLDYCDYVVLGDGEGAFVDLLEAIEGRRPLESVRNLAFRDSKGALQRAARPYHLVDMDELPLPDFSAAAMDRYFLPEPIYPLMLSRGCYWGRCTFCSIGWRENYRMASEEKIRADVRHVARHCGGRFVQLQDSSVPPKAAKLLSAAIRDEGLEVYWTSSMKFESCIKDPAYCNQLGGDGGCRSLHMGFESSDQRLLDLMDKGYRIDDLPLMLRNLKDAGISAELLWFVGFPGQSRRDALDTARFLFDHRHLFGLTSFVGQYFLHPDTDVFERPEDFGITVLDVDNDHCRYTVTRGMSFEEAARIEAMLASCGNRTLICNGSHLPHIAVTGHARDLARKLELKPEMVAFCAGESPAGDAMAAG